MLPGLYQAHQAIIIVSKDSKMSKHGAPGKRKHVTLTVPQKLEIIRGI
jgi:hypothetical protein